LMHFHFERNILMRYCFSLVLRICSMLFHTTFVLCVIFYSWYVSSLISFWNALKELH
jgi:hypothetical protein